MELVAACPRCGVRAKLPDDFPGGDLGCPQCGTVFAAPRAGGPGLLAAAAAPVATDPFAVWVGGTADLPPIVPMEPEPEDAAAHVAWLKNETQQFNEFVGRQLAALERRRQEIAAAESRAEAAFLPRQQELNRQRAAMVGRAEALKRREEMIRRREADLERLNVAITAREADLLDCEARLTELSDRVADLERREQKLLPAVAALEAKQAEVAALADGRAKLERRQAELDRAELTIQRRLAELDELERTLRRELEGSAPDLALR